MIMSFVGEKCKINQPTRVRRQRQLFFFVVDPLEVYAFLPAEVVPIVAGDRGLYGLPTHHELAAPAALWARRAVHAFLTWERHVRYAHICTPL